jgi:hypothetical protein
MQTRSSQPMWSAPLLKVLFLCFFPVTLLSQVQAGQAPEGLSNQEWGSIQEQVNLLEQQPTELVNASAALEPVFEQHAYLKSSNPGSSDWFGRSVAISGNTVVVGAENESSSSVGVNGNDADNSSLYSGAAYVFVRTRVGWQHQAYLKASNTGADDRFGWSVAISGDTVVVGARYESSDAIGVNGDGSNDSSVRSGAAYVFTRSEDIWSQQAYLKATNADAYDSFGWSVAISGDTLAVGANYEDSNAIIVNGDETNNSLSNAGAIYVFTRTGTEWSQQAYLKASNAGSDDRLGTSVAISGETVVAGARGEDSNTTGVDSGGSNNSAHNAGAAYVFTRTGTQWSQQAYLKASNTGGDDGFGVSVGISGDTLVVGANIEDSDSTGVDGDGTNNLASNAGAAYVFARADGVWSQQAYLKASNAEANDQVGMSVAISGESVVLGARFEDGNATGVDGGDEADNSVSNSGAAYVFIRKEGVWNQQAYLKASNTERDDDFGLYVAISGGVVVVTAHIEDSNATGVNGDETNNSVSGSGAAYVFGLPDVVFTNSFEN